MSLQVREQLPSWSCPLCIEPGVDKHPFRNKPGSQPSPEAPHVTIPSHAAAMNGAVLAQLILPSP